MIWKDTNVPYICRYCDCHITYIDNVYTKFKLTLASTIARLSSSRKSKELKSMSYHCIDNAFTGLTFSDPNLVTEGYLCVHSQTISLQTVQRYGMSQCGQYRYEFTYELTRITKVSTQWYRYQYSCYFCFVITLCIFFCFRLLRLLASMSVFLWVKCPWTLPFLICPCNKY